ncbi:MAG: trigger factor family protein, partial [Chitinivibrionia bacterium]|nr:trigger factor family protein [Chitinivibrionia bacterium]
MHDSHHHHHDHDHDLQDRNFTVQVSEPGQCKRMLTIEIPLEEVEKEEAAVFRKLKSDLKIPGFRKGRLPEKYIWKNYGDVIHSDAVQNLLPQIYEMALMKEKIAAVGDPNFESIKGKKGEPITLEVSVEVRPDISLKKYRDIEVLV